MKKITIFPIQISTQQGHSNSEGKFKGLWKIWKEQFTNFARIEINFVWLHN